MASTRNGDESVELQSIIQWAPTSYTTIRRFAGTRTYMESLAASAQSSGLKYVLSPGDGPNATLEIEYSGDATPTDAPISTEWTVATRAAQVPLEEHPFYNPYIVALTRLEKITLRQMLDGVTDEEIGNTSSGATNIATILAVNNAGSPLRYPLDELIAKSLAGTTSYLRPEVVLSLQLRYQASSDAVPVVARAGQAYTKSALTAANALGSGITVPTDLATALPAGDYLCEDVDWGASSDGSRVLTQTFRHATDWDSDLYTVNT